MCNIQCQFQILFKKNNLFQIVYTSPPTEKQRSPKTAKVIVKKMKPQSELDKPKPKM